MSRPGPILATWTHGTNLQGRSPWEASCSRCGRVLAAGDWADAHHITSTQLLRCRCTLIPKETPVPNRPTTFPVRMFAAELQRGYVVPAGQLYDHNGALIDEDLTITEVDKKPNGLLGLRVKGPTSGGGVHVGPDLSLEVIVEAHALVPKTTELTGVAARVLGEVLDERKRQDARWGKPTDRRIFNTQWLAVLMEEVGEVAKELNDYAASTGLAFPPEGRGSEAADRLDDHEFRVRLVTELVQVAAVAMAMAEAVHWANPEVE